MRTIFSCLLIALLSLGLMVNEASAKRFGGGRSFGVQRSQSSLFSNKVPNSASMKQKPNASRWGGMLGGLLVGGLLASLFMGNGLANGLITWLILGAAVFFIVNFIRRRMNPGLQTAQPNAFKNNSFNNFTQAFTNSSNSSSNTTNEEAQYPENFVPDSFLRNAKVSFIRLQAAYDQKNLQDLSSFTVPEVFAEIKMQLDERGDEPNKTEVITLDAELLDVSKQALSTVASVRFTGTIKENNEAISQLDEIWHFCQFNNNSDWVVTGVQQEVIRP